MNNIIKVLFFPVGGKPYIREVKNELRALQALVGGYIEVFPLDSLYGAEVSES